MVGLVPHHQCILFLKWFPGPNLRPQVYCLALQLSVLEQKRGRARFTSGQVRMKAPALPKCLGSYEFLQLETTSSQKYSHGYCSFYMFFRWSATSSILYFLKKTNTTGLHQGNPGLLPQWQVSSENSSLHQNDLDWRYLIALYVGGGSRDLQMSGWWVN